MKKFRKHTQQKKIKKKKIHGFAVWNVEDYKGNLYD